MQHALKFIDIQHIQKYPSNKMHNFAPECRNYFGGCGQNEETCFPEMSFAFFGTPNVISIAIQKIKN
jgi:hypothetical protein